MNQLILLVFSDALKMAEKEEEYEVCQLLLNKIKEVE